jgi:hypothetical protein
LARLYPGHTCFFKITCYRQVILRHVSGHPDGPDPFA